MTFRELCAKEIVQLQNGVCLGKADDLTFDPQTAQITSLQLTIPWKEIERIGLDAILVHTELPPLEEKAAKPTSVWERLKHWLKG